LILPSAGVHDSAPAGFDFTSQVRLLCGNMVQCLPQLSHIDMSRVAVGFAQTRSRAAHGMQASLTPLRFEGGALSGQRHGQHYRIQRVFDRQGREFLYILTLYLPRFLEHPLEEKVETLLHELWHISPCFDGDLRRFAGRCYAHGRSQKEYDAQVNCLAQAWWAAAPPEETYAFLRFNYRQLCRLHGRVVGCRIPHPKLIPETR